MLLYKHKMQHLMFRRYVVATFIIRYMFFVQNIRGKQH